MIELREQIVALVRAHQPITSTMLAIKLQSGIGAIEQNLHHLARQGSVAREGSLWKIAGAQVDMTPKSPEDPAPTQQETAMPKRTFTCRACGKLKSGPAAKCSCSGGG